ncbi:hypothetical protein [Qipengyuania sp.]|uniref:hypothetical protein n=1 Tax=Qipengyuania sp. TaxID=2004515 RepID=UPI003736A642
MSSRISSHEQHHDDADKYALGGVLTLIGLRRGDAPALDALLSKDTKYLFVEAMQPLRATMPIGELIRKIIDTRAEELHVLGKAAELERRRAAYRAARASWDANGDKGANASWRKRPVTRNQRFLIANVCQTARIEPPELSTRGQAADWLELRTAHPQLRGDDE